MYIYIYIYIHIYIYKYIWESRVERFGDFPFQWGEIHGDFPFQRGEIHPSEPAWSNPRKSIFLLSELRVMRGIIRVDQKTRVFRRPVET